jgi:predicted house-cleaning NTP pyrophosphatase (Maf/HAM1 superfamily)
VDRQLVTMRRFTPGEARQYVERFEPFDSSGSYRLEDQERMAPLEPFVTEVRGEHDSGVLGLPLPLLDRLLAELAAQPGE